MSSQPQDIYCLMIPTSRDNIILPNAAVAEIMPYYDVDDPESDAPEWLLGMLNWRARKVPVVSMEVLDGGQSERPDKRSRLAIVRSLSDDSPFDYLALLVQGIPRMVQLTRDASELVDDEVSTSIRARIQLGSQSMAIPHLEQIESKLREAIVQSG